MDPNDQAGGIAIVGDPGDGSWLDGPILRELVRLRRGQATARVVLASVGLGGHPGGFDRLRRALASLGVVDVRSLGVVGRDDAERPSTAALVERASTIIIEGDLRRMVPLLAETRLDAALRRRIEDPLMIVGVGPGASALAGWMILDDPDEPESLALLDGLGLDDLAGSVLDPAFAADGRLDRLMPAVGERPDALGIGVGPSTALILRRWLAKVVGAGSVTLLGTSDDTDFGGPGPLIRHILAHGDRFDFRSRTPIPPGPNGLA